MLGNIRLKRDGIRELEHDADVATALRPHAEDVLGRARRKAPSWLTAQWFVRQGVSKRGAFAQAIARGSGTILAEYGGSRSHAYRYMRSAAR